jgi:ubiquinone/menaquinone biosynthesis C-methylase UbiE
MTTEHFYDRAAKILAGYTPEQLHDLRALIAEPNPEALFTRLVAEGLRPDDRVLDIGTGDGFWFMETAAPRAAVALGIDDGEARLRQGAAAKTRLRIAVALVKADARFIPLPDASMSVVLNRRGPFGDASDPRFFTEGLRVLAAGGRIYEIGIGELNEREVSQVFGRGQMLADENRGRIVERVAEHRRRHGLRVDYIEDTPTFEYFPNRESLELRLLTAPILEDFDPDKEAHLVDEVMWRNSTERGIRLTFHRTILISTKAGK